MPEAILRDKDQCIMHTEKIHKLELSMVEIQGDVKHIRERIDNGLSATVTKVWDKLQAMSTERAKVDQATAVDRAKIETIVSANSSFIDKLKNALIWVSVTGVAGGIVTLVFKLIHSYISNNA